MRTAGGSLLVLLSAVGFGSLALCAHVAYADGVDTATMLALRFVLAALVLAAVVAVRRIALPRGAALRGYLLMGVVYAGMAWGYFSALRFASSSTVALVLYTYPVVVAAVSAALRIDRFGLPESLAFAGSALGLALLLGTALHGSPAGVALAFASALAYAGYIVVGSKLGDTGTNALAGSCVVLACAGVVFTVLAAATGFHVPRGHVGWEAVGAVTLVGGVLAIAAFIAGLQAVGPTLASILSTLEPVVTIALGVGFLGEALQRSTLLGAVLIVGSAIGLSVARARRAPATVRAGLAFEAAKDGSCAS